MTDDHIEKYRQLFDEFDEDNGGTIDLRELNTMLRSVGQEMDPKDLKEIIDEFDQDGSGEIDFEEFLQIFVKILSGVDPQGEESESFDESNTHESIDPLTGHIRKCGGRYRDYDPDNHIGPIILSEDQLNKKPVKAKKLKIFDKSFIFFPGIDWDYLKVQLDADHPRETLDVDPDFDSESKSVLSTMGSMRRTKLKR